MEMCKNCGSIHINGSNFCTRKCRLDWIERYKFKNKNKSHIADRILDRQYISGEWKR